MIKRIYEITKWVFICISIILLFIYNHKFNDQNNYISYMINNYTIYERTIENNLALKNNFFLKSFQFFNTKYSETVKSTEYSLIILTDMQSCSNCLVKKLEKIAKYCVENALSLENKISLYVRIEKKVDSTLVARYFNSLNLNYAIFFIRGKTVYNYFLKKMDSPIFLLVDSKGVILDIMQPNNEDDLYYDNNINIILRIISHRL